MALKLRLTRMGSKKKPFYRIVAVNSEARRDGRALDYVGYYNPMTDPADIKIDQDKVAMWMQRGAKPTETVQSLLKKSGLAS
ncbi:MAG: 30S ribosomal protein S16 [Desulfovibrionales bacterium]|nr:30S ribosomal protein S16 [Desulfovibrionales bacterium]